MGWKKNLLTVVLSAAAGGVLVRHFFWKPPMASQAPPAGYRANAGSKVLHQPGCRFYDPEKLTAPFWNLEEAALAGFRPCKQCFGPSQ